jgi:hypothetical protein
MDATALRLLTCQDADCSARTATTLSISGTEADRPALAFDSRGYPVVSFYEDAIGALMLVTWDDERCTEPSLHIIDNNVNVGPYNTSLRLDGQGNAYIAYYDHLLGDLKLAIFELPYRPPPPTDTPTPTSTATATPTATATATPEPTVRTPEPPGKRLYLPLLVRSGG